MLADVSLVWKNCHTFNAAGSEINQLCDETQAAFNQRWQQAGLPVSKSGKPRAEPRRRKPNSTTAAHDRPTRRSAVQASHDPAADSGNASAEQHPDGQGGPRAGRYMGRASQDRGDAAEPNQATGGEGKGPNRAHGKAPKRMRSLSELPSEPNPAEHPRKLKKRKRQAADGGAELEGPLATALGVVKGMLKVKAAAPFTRPVLESQVPGYHQVVKKPMDLSTVRDGIQEGQYSDTGEHLVLSWRLPCISWL